MAKSVTSLRNKVDCDCDGIHQLQEKVETLKDAPKPMTELKIVLASSDILFKVCTKYGDHVGTPVPIIEIRCKIGDGPEAAKCHLTSTKVFWFIFKIPTFLFQYTCRLMRQTTTECLQGNLWRGGDYEWNWMWFFQNSRIKWQSIKKNKGVGIQTREFTEGKQVYMTIFQWQWKQERFKCMGPVSMSLS